MCEIEFPAYFNFFLKNKSVNLITIPDTATILTQILDETIEGPEAKFLFVDEEYPENRIKSSGRFSFAARPNHAKEINYFKEPRGGREITTKNLIQFSYLLPFQDQMVSMSENAKQIVQKELDFLRKLNVLAEDSHQNEVGATEVKVVLLGQEIEIIETPMEYIVVDGGEEVARIQCFLVSWTPVPSTITAAAPRNIVDPPEFGVTILGSSHGFDPQGTTSGFVVWMHKKGIMVDPPPNATELLQASGIIPSMITGIILTHCHADHDAGAFQKILKEGKITLITTKTIFDSFIRKYSLISGFAEIFLLRLFEHRLVNIGDHFHWEGGTLRFFYSLHALPCIGFEAMVSGKTFAYSADTFYQPDGIRELRDKGYLSTERCEALLDFPIHYDLVLHEAGIPPIHTPVATLCSLPDKIKKNLYIIHVADSVGVASGLQVAKAGVENTLVIEIPVHEYAVSASILQLLRSTDIFRQFSISQASDLLQLSRLCTFEPDDYICRAGEIGMHFYIILSGFCCVQLTNTEDKGLDLHRKLRLEDRRDSARRDSIYSCASSRTLLSQSSLDSLAGFEQQQNKVFSAGEYLGELALLTEQKIRSADIVAISKVSLIKLDNHAFKYLLDTTPGLQYRMERLSTIRCSLSWKAIGANSVLCKLMSAQRSQLQSIMQVLHIKKGAYLWQRDQPVSRAFLVASGKLELVEMRDELETPFRIGSFFCNVPSMVSVQDHGRDRKKKIVTSKVSLIAITSADLYYIEAEDMLEFLDHNPGIFVNLVDTFVLE